MRQQRRLLAVVLVLAVAAVLWFTLGLPEVYRNQDAIVATHEFEQLLIESAVIATSRSEFRQSADPP